MQIIRNIAKVKLDIKQIALEILFQFYKFLIIRVLDFCTISIYL